MLVFSIMPIYDQHLLLHFRTNGAPNSTQLKWHCVGTIE